MRDATRPATTAATRRSRIPAGAVLVALAWAAATAGAPPPSNDSRFAPGAGLSADDQTRIGAAVLFQNGGDALAESAAVAAGQDAKLWPRPSEERPVVDPDDQARVGAATLFLKGFPGGPEAPTELAYLAAGQDLRFWTFFDPNFVRRIPKEDLETIEDRTPIPSDAGDREQMVYFDMIIYANRTAPAALDKAARRDDDLWAKVFHEPSKYRGEVLHFEGRLKKLRRFEPQAMAVQGGARDYYEGYLSVGAWQDDPVFFICTELPPDLKPGDNLDVPVGFSGYFYKIFRYTAADSKETRKDRLAPLLIGHTITPLGAPAVAAEDSDEGGWSIWLGPMVFGLIAVCLAFFLTLGYWLRGADRRVQKRISAVRHGEFIPPPEDALDEPPK
jgi:hypothetical protein